MRVGRTCECPHSHDLINHLLHLQHSIYHITVWGSSFGKFYPNKFFWWISALGWFLSITLKDKDFKVLPLLLPVFIVLSFYPSQLSYSSFRNMFSQIHLKLQSISCFFYVNRFISTWNFGFHPLNSFRSDFQFFLHSPLFLKTDKKLSMYFSKNGLEIKLL